MKFVLEPLIVTKELIFSRVSEENLMEYYTGIPCKKGLFISKMRPDSRPTVSYYRNNKTGRLIYKDFGNGFTADCIGVVMHKYNCTYGKALSIIANDFNIITNNKLEVNKPLIKLSNTKFEDIGDAIIQVEIKDFSQYELDWWSKYGITENTLKKFRVFSCKNIFLNNNLFLLGKEKQLIFGYFGGIREGIERWKVYLPGRKFRFLSNWKQHRLQGIDQIPKTGEYLVITKSQKDNMTLYELGIPAVSPISENCFMTDAWYNKLKERFNKLFLFYDSDLPGLRAMNKIRKLHPEIIPIWIPRHYEAKDISDFYAKYKREKTVELINEAKKYFLRKEEKY